MAENREYITNQVENGTVNINEEVIATIAAAAVREVDGIVSLGGTSVDDQKLSRKTIGKGIRVILGEDNVEVECNLVVLYGHSVVEIAKNVQNGVANAIESMAGLKVSRVDVNITGISMSKA